eukprot:jgi/Galph1/2443/GphlegSOOS_G1130.1
METKGEPSERVAIWNKTHRRKIGGNAAPLRRNLETYLRKHPDCEVYCGQDLYRETLSFPRPILPRRPEGEIPVTTEFFQQTADYSYEVRRQLLAWGKNEQGVGYEDIWTTQPLNDLKSTFVPQLYNSTAGLRTNYSSAASLEVPSYEKRAYYGAEDKINERDFYRAPPSATGKVSVERIVDGNVTYPMHISQVSQEGNVSKPSLPGLRFASDHHPARDLESHVDNSWISPGFSLSEGSFPSSASVQTPYSIDSSGSSYSLKEKWALLRAEATRELLTHSTSRESDMSGSLSETLNTPLQRMDFEYYSSFSSSSLDFR